MDNYFDDLVADLEDYSSLVAFLGRVTKVDENSLCVLCSEGVELEFLLHREVVDALKEDDIIIFEDDLVDILGVYVLVGGKPKIMALRCVVYDEPAKLVC